MRFTEFRYFLAAIEAGSFGRAALSLGLRPSTLSRAIGRLEDQIGIALIERSSGGVQLTAMGRIAQRHVRRVLREVRALEDAMERGSAGTTGEIHLGLYLPPVNSLLTKLLLEWRTAYPAVSVTPHEPSESTLLAALISYEIDAALIPDFLVRDHKASLPVYFEPLMAVVPVNHLLASRDAVRWSDLEAEKLLLWAWGKDGIGQEFFSSRLPGVSVSVFETGTMTLLAFVRAGYGITIAAQAYSSLNLPGLTFVPINEENARINVNLIWRPESEDPVLGRFVAFIRDQAQPRRSAAASLAASENLGPRP